MGLFVGSGKVISLAGGLGATIAFVVGGFMITCVMLCLGEMVAFRHEAGAIFEYPKLFVSHALGFAVGIIYWLAYTTSLVTLIVTSADLLALDPGQRAGLTTGLIIVIAIANLLGGVKVILIQRYEIVFSNDFSYMAR
jgi:amino acid permease